MKALDGPTIQSIDGPVLAAPGWAYSSALAPSVLNRSSRLGRFAHRIAAAPPDALALERFASLATGIPTKTGECTSIGVTATAAGNRLSLSVITLATLWARWHYRVVIVDLSGGRSELGKLFDESKPTIAGIVDALLEHRSLPTPSPLTTTLDSLDAVGGLGPYSMAQLLDSGLLIAFAGALRERYDRVIWILPYSSSHGALLRRLDSVLDQIVVSACRGRASLDGLTRIADETAELRMPPVQCVWHR